MRYFIDEREVSEEEYKEKLRSQLYILITENVSNFLNSEEKRAFNNLSEFEKELAYHKITRKNFDKYYALEQQELRNYRFKKEK